MRQQLVALDIGTGRERVVNTIDPRVRIRAVLIPGLRLSLSPDGKSVVTTSRMEAGDIWMVEDFVEQRRVGGGIDLVRNLFAR